MSTNKHLLASLDLREMLEAKGTPWKPDETVGKVVIRFTSHSLQLVFLEVARARELHASAPRKSRRRVLVTATFDDLAAALAEGLRLHRLVSTQSLRAVIDVFQIRGLQVPPEYMEELRRHSDLVKTGGKESS